MVDSALSDHGAFVEPDGLQPGAASAPEPPQDRLIRVFLSSTFRDFLQERELLAKRVFPALNRKARERGVELVEVDLRWGVTQSQAEDGHALEICLREIERCKPYFIGMLGDSYGSATPARGTAGRATAAGS